ncbi:estradiol 17-beta-dehydrogenase 11-like isoform X3 [Bacillus rossius redtenbacheri]
MLHRLYSSLVLCYDTVHMVVGIICSIIESTIHIFKPPVAKSVKGEVALVVGAGHGVGRELALQLATLGATVVCWDADHGAGRETAEAAGGEARAYLCDVSDREQILQTARLVQKEVGDVSILIHCGGAPSRCRSLSELTLEDTKAMSDSIFSYFWVLEAFLPRMRAANRGHVAVLSSAAGLAGAGERVALRTAQFAAQGLVESLAEELRVSGLGGVRLTLASVHPRAAAIDDAASARCGPAPPLTTCESRQNRDNMPLLETRGKFAGSATSGTDSNILYTLGQMPTVHWLVSRLDRAACDPTLL